MKYQRYKSLEDRYKLMSDFKKKSHIKNYLYFKTSRSYLKPK